MANPEADAREWREGGAMRGAATTAVAD